MSNLDENNDNNNLNEESENIIQDAYLKIIRMAEKVFTKKESIGKLN